MGAKEKHCVRLVSYLEAHDPVVFAPLIWFSTLAATQARLITVFLGKPPQEVVQKHEAADSANIQEVLQRCTL